MSEPTVTKSVALLRVVVGGWLLWSALPNLDRSFIEQLPATLDVFAQANPYGPVRWVLHQVVYPYAEQIGTIFSVGQLLLAGAIGLGFFTRQAAGLGLMVAVGLWFLCGHLSPFHHNLWFLLTTIFGVLVLADSGRCYGLDYWVFKNQNVSELPNKLPKTKFKSKKQKDLVNALAKEVSKSTKKQKSKS
jgi:uncharacterized membrane protein YphA (DoxX/SURF4 family)